MIGRRTPFLPILMWTSTACIFVDGGGLTPGGSGSGKGGSAGDGGADGAVSGVGCTVMTSNGTMLCKGTSECPGVTVSQNSWSGCGYKIAGRTLDLECECTGFLCSLGPATTCAQASQLLVTQTMSGVCGAAAQGSCVDESFSPDASMSSGSCDMSCASSCASGDMTCLQFCGC